MVRTRGSTAQKETPKINDSAEAVTKSKSRKRSRKKNETDEGASKSKKTKSKKSEDTAQDEGKQEQPKINKAKLDIIFADYGVLPLQDSGLVKIEEATPETILALVYMAMLTSARISHVLAYQSVKCLLEAGYHDLKKLKQSTWEERTEVLTKGGYTRYREKTATALGELAEFVEERYDGDLNNLLKRADSQPEKVRNLLQEIKGLGKVGLDIFFDSAQGVWPVLAPFIDPRSLETAKRCGLGDNVNAMWAALDRNSIKMCKLSSALTMIRLDKKEKDYE
ncbi:hypothetical protein ACLMJK_008183 [Lecanora helva]